MSRLQGKSCKSSRWLQEEISAPRDGKLSIADVDYEVSSHMYDHYHASYMQKALCSAASLMGCSRLSATTLNATRTLDEETRGMSRDDNKNTLIYILYEKTDPRLCKYEIHLVVGTGHQLTHILGPRVYGIFAMSWLYLIDGKCRSVFRTLLETRIFARMPMTNDGHPP